MTVKDPLSKTISFIQSSHLFLIPNSIRFVWELFNNFLFKPPRLCEKALTILRALVSDGALLFVAQERIVFEETLHNVIVVKGYSGPGLYFML